MKKTTLKTILFATASMLIFSVTSCKNDNNNDNDNDNENKKTITFENLVPLKDFVESGEILGVTNSNGNLTINPGESQSITFSAGKAQSLMFVTMYKASKDWFFSSAQPGIKLFDTDGKAITGDVSSQVQLWDNGTKENTSGQIESKPIRLVPNIDASQLMKLYLTYDDISSEFTLKITNTSGGTLHETPFSSGVWAISNFNGVKLANETPFFKPNFLSNPELTDIAEMGNITKMKTKLAANTGLVPDLSEGLIVVYTGDKNPIFELGKLDAGIGLKELSQMGVAAKLQNSLKALSYVKGVYKIGNILIAPGEKASTSFEAGAGDKLAYVTMFGISNDWFYSNNKVISGNTKGDLTSSTTLYDSGTGIDQYPGAGNNQVVFGGTPLPESKIISEVVGNKYPIPPLKNIIKVTVN
ncbi:spondin domain-containing protein [Chryseobacterium sp. Chry.R1]|uniref:spondin domain-containing protein n=1 Tax=Chryseobacterium sp. Chry.R1 TaxID=3139392 RepID=UPI0031FA0078